MNKSKGTQELRQAVQKLQGLIARYTIRAYDTSGTDRLLPPECLGSRAGQHVASYISEGVDELLERMSDRGEVEVDKTGDPICSLVEKDIAQRCTELSVCKVYEVEPHILISLCNKTRFCVSILASLAFLKMPVSKK